MKTKRLAYVDVAFLVIVVINFLLFVFVVIPWTLFLAILGICALYTYVIRKRFAES